MVSMAKSAIKRKTGPVKKVETRLLYLEPLQSESGSWTKSSMRTKKNSFKVIYTEVLQTDLSLFRINRTLDITK